MKSPFGRIEDLFNTLNDAGVKYLVLRNYENLLEPELYVDGHGDINMLCSDSQEIVDLRAVIADISNLCTERRKISVRSKQFVLCRLQQV